jgi:DNA-binding MarR family transcriptional regulator
MRANDNELGLKYEIMKELGYAAHILRRTAHRMLEPYGVSWGQPPVLRCLHEYDGCIQRDIAENCHIQAATISSVLDTMEQGGHIRRGPAEGDRRAQRVFLTEKGRRIYETVNGVFRQLDERSLKGVEGAELAAFRGTLNKIMANLDEIGREQEGVNQNGQTS